MTAELLATLRKWLASDDPVERAHARWRLGRQDALAAGRAESEADAERAAALIAEFPPERNLGVGRPCGGCPDGV